MKRIRVGATHTMLRVPKPLSRGDAVGVVAVSGPPEDDCLRAGVSFLEDQGFRAVLGCNVGRCHYYCAGTDDERVGDLNAMINNPQVKAILFARGGYGVMRILDAVDVVALSQAPKLLIGMSDLTALHMSLYTRCGLVTLAGPMVAGQMSRGLDELSRQSLLCRLTTPLDGSDLFQPVASNLRILRHGRVEGILLGGCLSMVTALLGTSHFPDCHGSILFLEDVNEPPYRIDRMLTHLRLAGILADVSAIILGQFHGPDGTTVAQDVERIVMEVTSDHPIPIVCGLPHGHGLPNLTLPHGAPVALDTSVPSMSGRLMVEGN